jgi:hypothetical protein
MIWALIAPPRANSLEFERGESDQDRQSLTRCYVARHLGKQGLKITFFTKDLHMHLAEPDLVVHLR